MKQKFLAVLVLLSFVVLNKQGFSQTFDFEKEGFLHNIKLIDVKAEYLVVSPLQNANGIRTTRAGITAFDGKIIGQTANYAVTGRDGLKITFETVVAVINFFAFNGWELVGRASNVIIDASEFPEGMLFKKKNR